MGMTYIYALRDPRDGKAFYVGKSSRLNTRFADHCSARPREKNPLRRKMILQLRAEEFSPMLHILECCSDGNWQEREIFWIAEYRRLGHPLCNSHVGGFGWPHGVKQNPLVVAHRAAANRGKKRSEEVKERIRQSNLRTWADPELKKRHRKYGVNLQASLAKKTPEQKQVTYEKLRQSTKKRWVTDRERETANLKKMQSGFQRWVTSLSPEERRQRALTASEAAKAVNRKENHARL